VERRRTRAPEARAAMDDLGGSVTAREELERFRWLLDNIPAEIGVFDRKGRFEFNTPLGIADPEVRRWVLGKRHHDYCRQRGYPPEIADRRQEAIERCLREMTSVSFEEVWTDRKGQRRFYVRTFAPVADPDGELNHVIGYGQEITELKRAEDELRRAHGELEAEVEVRRRAEAELRIALAAVEELRARLEAENEYLQEEIRTEHGLGEILGDSVAMRSVLEAITTVAPTEANVVVTGETGTGKELVARALHEASRRRDKPLIKVNCASIPRELFESEFFGHVKGAFTGALRERAGRFQLADGGTLFLDEIGDIPLSTQSKLLRVLQEGEYERVGEERTRRVDVRIIAATNRDLKTEIADGRFRQDLYYRLNVFPIQVPPLRDRAGDIALLAARFLELIARGLGRPVPKLTAEHLRRLEGYVWPGNVRELRNTIERAVITSRSGALRLDLPGAAASGASSGHAGADDETPEALGDTVVPDSELRRRERENTIAVLRVAQGKIYGPGGAAELLGLKPTTLAYRIRKMGLASEAVRARLARASGA